MNNTSNTDKIIENLEIENSLLKQQVEELQTKIDWFMEQYLLSRHKQFKSSSEHMIPEQINLFNEAEFESRPEAPEPKMEEVTYKRRKRTGQREEMFDGLPVETIIYDLPEEQQNCKCCNGKLHKMSEQVRREFAMIPAQVKVTEHIQYVYACRDCDKNEITTPIVTAPMPNPALPGSIAAPSAIAYVMTEKFVKGLPLYRQEQDWKRLGIDISRQTMSNWMIQSSEKWLVPVYTRMKEYLVKNDILHADETTVQVLHEPERAAVSKSYMWLYRTGRDGPPIVLYDYQTTRAGKHPKAFLKDFKGFLHVDGYDGYSDMPDITLVGCWSHARRYFVEAIKSMPQNTKGDKLTISEEGLNFCNKLFAIERDLHDVTAEMRYDGRFKMSHPVLDEFKNWLNYQSPRVLPKSALGKAIFYCRNQWKKLEGFMKDGRLELDNNRSERSIKPFVMGRKAWLFSNTPKGASASATIYSIVETSKENGLNPFAYLTYLFEHLPNIDVKDQDALDALLPWSSSLPDYCRVPVKNISQDTQN